MLYAHSARQNQEVSAAAGLPSSPQTARCPLRRKHPVQKPPWRCCHASEVLEFVARPWWFLSSGDLTLWKVPSLLFWSMLLTPGLSDVWSGVGSGCVYVFSRHIRAAASFLCPPTNRHLTLIRPAMYGIPFDF